MNERKKANTDIKTGAPEAGIAGDEALLRSYARPQVLSAENLEAAAVTCAPPAGGFGKHTPIPCGKLGS